MIAATKSPTPPQVVDFYLGFEIRQIAKDALVALPRGWSHQEMAMLEAPDLPAMRKRIWGWWHRLLD